MYVSDIQTLWIFTNLCKNENSFLLQIINQSYNQVFLTDTHKKGEINLYKLLKAGSIRNDGSNNSQKLHSVIITNLSYLTQNRKHSFSPYTLLLLTAFNLTVLIQSSFLSH
jgi:hypothetical protein